MELAAVFLQLLFLVLQGEGATSQSTTSEVVFLGAPYTKTINQNDLQGKMLFQARCAYQINGSVSTGGNFHYSLLLDDQYTDRFSIGSSTGKVFLIANALDIEAEGRWSPTILCSDLDQATTTNNLHPVPTTTEFTVQFELENRYPPVFVPRGPIDLVLREDQVVPYDVVTLNATDEDLGVCGEFKMSINGWGYPFHIRESDNVLQLFSELDYETRSSYTLTIRAENIESSCAPIALTSATIDVRITVIDVNDEPPMFNDHQILFQFNETTMPSNFVQLNCTDPDTPPSGIIYTEQYPLRGNPFRIDHQTGMVTAMDEIDYEAASSYELRFACIDSLNQQLRDETSILIEVLPVNEFIPQINTQTVFCQVSELSPRGTLIGSTSQTSGAFVVYQATDQDRGLDHGDVRYRFSRRNTDLDFVNRHFDLDEETGDFTLDTPLPFYSCNDSSDTDDFGARIVTVKVIVCDRFSNSSEPLDHECPTLTIRMLVTPSDCTPTFLKNQTVMNISEGTPVGTRLLTLPCNVRGQRTSERTIEILSLDRGVLKTFTLEDDTIVLQKNLDYESSQNYSFFLECSGETNSNVASIYVQVVPENDNKPYFKKNLFVFNVNRSVLNSEGSYTLDSVQAFDDDLEIGNQLEYRLSPNLEMDQNNDVMDFVTIDAIFGTISVSSDLEQIGEDVLVFDVVAFDGNFTTESSVLVKLDRQECPSVSVTNEKSKNHYVYIPIALLILALLVITLVVVGNCAFCCYRTRKIKQRTELRFNNNISSATYDLPTGYASLRRDKQMQDTTYSKFNSEDNPAKLLESNLDYPEKQDELDYHYVAPNTYQGQGTTFGHNVSGAAAPPQSYLAPSGKLNTTTAVPLGMDDYLDMRPTFQSALSSSKTDESRPMMSSSHGENPSAHPPTGPAPPPPPPPPVVMETEQLCQSPLRRYSVDNIYEHIK